MPDAMLQAAKVVIAPPDLPFLVYVCMYAHTIVHNVGGNTVPFL